MVNGKRIKKALSESFTEARRLRDQYLMEIKVYGDIQRNENASKYNPLFGELAQKWAKIKSKQIKNSTMRDYKSSMNLYVLPRFGNIPIRDITYLDVEEFKSDLDCTPKRINNILVPMRSVFSMALKNGIIQDNIMLIVDNLRTDEPLINPLTIEEAKLVVENVHPYYKNFFVTALFTGMRFGEMAGLKWKNVELDRGIIHICETLVYGVEGRPKTKKSNRDIDLLPPVVEALEDQKRMTFGKSKYVFLDVSGKPLKPDHVREVIWKPALKKAGIEYRPMMLTRHTFATMMIDAGEDIGWVQKMLGHGSLQMIYTKYYSWIKKNTRNDGTAFMTNLYEKTFGQKESSVRLMKERIEIFTPILHQIQKKGSHQNDVSP
jgi:integrase